jgi:hypothetical protein
MTLNEFVEKWKRKGESVIFIAEKATSVEDDDEFVKAARALIKAEDKFYVMMLERGLEQ